MGKLPTDDSSEQAIRIIVSATPIVKKSKPTSLPIKRAYSLPIVYQEAGIGSQWEAAYSGKVKYMIHNLLAWRVTPTLKRPMSSSISWLATALRPKPNSV